MILRTILAMFVASVPSLSVAQTAKEKQTVAGFHPEGWKPADLPHILAEHGKWKPNSSIPSTWTEEDFSQGRANLCNAFLLISELNGAVALTAVG